MPQLTQRIGFIGAGQMATALGQGFVRAGLVEGGQVSASDPLSESLQLFAQATGGEVTNDNLAVANHSDILFLAVKPQQMGRVLADLRGRLGSADKLVVSIAAGVRLATLAEALGREVRLVRVMPNTPCLVGRGACGYCLGQRASADDARLVEPTARRGGHGLPGRGKAHRCGHRALGLGTGLRVPGDRGLKRRRCADGPAPGRGHRTWPPRP